MVLFVYPEIHLQISPSECVQIAGSDLPSANEGTAVPTSFQPLNSAPTNLLVSSLNDLHIYHDELPKL